MKKPNLALFSVYALIFIDAIGLGVIYPVLAPIFLNDKLGDLPSNAYYMQNILYGLALTIFPLCMFLGAPILGELSDKYGRKPILLASLIGSALGFFISGLGIKTANLELIFIGRSIDGFTAGAVPIAQAVIADLSTEQNLQRRMGLVGFANAIGFAIGPAIGGFFSNNLIVTWFGLATPFIIAGLLATFNVILMLKAFKESSKGKREAAINIATGFINIKESFANNNIRVLSLAFSLFILGYFGFFNYMSVFFDKVYNASGERIGDVITFFAICFAVSLLILLPKASKRFSTNTILMFSMGFQPIGLIIFTIFKFDIVSWIILAPLAIAFSFAYVTYITLFSMRTDQAFQGRIMGVIASLTALAWAIGPMISAVLQKFGVMIPIFLFIILELASFIIVGNFIVKSRKTGDQTC